MNRRRQAARAHQRAQGGGRGHDPCDELLVYLDGVASPLASGEHDSLRDRRVEHLAQTQDLTGDLEVGRSTGAVGA
jgi:hypothetical protein